ncbi:MAG TPA: glycosyltransferase family 4 protein [Gemmatimonadales bacterium]|nr:glycosyltransferase family 4 protein [Gemmatimonadales bacterium]
MTASSLRLAYLSNFAPRKLGSGEGRLIAFAREARRRGHHLTVFGGEPVHPEVATALQGEGAAWEPIVRLERHPVAGGRELARRFDVLQLNMVGPRSRIAMAAYLAWPTRVLFVDRVSGGVQAPRPSPVRSALDWVTMHRVARVVGISEYVRERAERRFALPPGRSVTIHNGVDVARFRPRGAERRPGALRVIVVANLIPEKGVGVLLDALAGMPDLDWVLEVVGDGPELAALETRARVLGVGNRVRFLGLRDDVPELLREADVAVHPARWQEALGNTVLEAMATALPLVASGVGGIPELLRDGEEGLLVPPGDPAALGAALRLLAGDPGLRAHLGAAARARILREFTLDASVRRYLDLCEQVGEAGRPAPRLSPDGAGPG